MDIKICACSAEGTPSTRRVTNGNEQLTVPLVEDQILGLAPDTFIMRAGRGLAFPEKWHLLAFNNAFFWGVFPSLKQIQIHTLISRQDMTVICSCNSRKFPCRHVVALLLLAEKRPFLFSHLLPDGWVARQQNRLRQEQQRKQQKASRRGSALDTRDERERLARLQAGLAKLELWLKDLVRHGLALLPDRSKQYWIEIADQLVDAEAPEIAHQLRQMAAIPVKQPDWSEQYLQRIGQLFLLIQGFKQWASLPEETRTDLKTAVGWFPPPFSQTETQLQDDWFVLGHMTRTISDRNLHYTWLWGVHSNRPAAMLQLLQRQRPSGATLATGSLLQGEMQFDKSHWPLYAHATSLVNLTRPYPPPAGFTSINAALRSYTDAIALRPWIGPFPLLLQQVRPYPTANSISLIDEGGFLLPITTPFFYRWHLQAIGGGSPLALFGVWDGRSFNPLSINTEQGWIDLHILKGVK